jgi:hypothetical protein
LVVEVAGSDPSPPEFDILQVSGGIQLGGILLASTSGGYDPAEGQTFEIITGSPVSGTFIPQIIKGFEIDYQPGAVLLVATGAGLAYATWAASYELAGDAALPGMDPDGDGQVNFLEYAFNTSPILAAASPTRFAVEENGGHAWLVLRYRMWQDRVDAGLNYQPQRSADLGVWLTEGIIDEPDLGAPPLAGSAARRCRIPLHPGSREFLRLGVGF